MTLPATSPALVGIVLSLRLAGAVQAAAGAPAAAAPVSSSVSSPAQPAGAACPAGGKFITDAFSPKPAFAQQTRASRPAASTGYTVEKVIGDVARGRSMAMLPDGRFLLAELGGRIRLVGAHGGAGALIAGGPSIPEPSTLVGLQDIVLDPDFARNRIVYLSYGMLRPGQAASGAFAAPPESLGHIVKARLSTAEDRFEDIVELYQGPQVRRMAAGRDATLYVYTVAGGAKAQVMSDDSGKILRIRTDGTVPADNPFAGRTDAGRFVYALGFRDGDGLAFDQDGRLWATEHGPRGGDELNLIHPGRNYGFPEVSYGRTYGDTPINGGLTARDGLEQPVYFWTPDVAPSGLMVYSGKMFPQWKGQLFAATLVAGSLVRLTLKDDKVVSEEFMLSQRCSRIRDVREAADGSIYVLTDAPAGEVLRLSRAPSPET